MSENLKVIKSNLDEFFGISENKEDQVWFYGFYVFGTSLTTFCLIVGNLGY